MHYLFSAFESISLIMLTPLFIGILRKLKAILRGYQGPILIQPYFDLIKLFQKGRIISNQSSFITQIGPIISFSAAVTSIFFIPVFYTGGEYYLGNIFIIIFLFGTVKLFITLIGLDSASTFGGMGSSRELYISMLVEPIMFLIVAFLYFETKTFNIFKIAIINDNLNKISTPHIVAACAFFLLILAENSRLPVDNPETHLELTMVHEAMILDLSGSDLALMELTSSIKFVAFLTIFINTFFPFGISTTYDFVFIIGGIIFFIVKIIFCLGIVSIIETSISKFRLFRLPELLAAAFSIAIAALILNYFI